MIKIYNRLHFLIALNPIIWLCGISTPFCLTGAYVFRNTPTIPTILIIAAIVPVWIICILYLLFSLFFPFLEILFPKKFQSKEHQLHHNNLIKKYQFSIPILWLCGFSVPLFIVGAYAFAFKNVQSIPIIILIITAILPIGTACIFLTTLFFFFTKYFSENLLSENNQLHHNDSTKKSRNLDPNSNSQLGDKTLIEMGLKDAVEKLRDLNRIDLNELNLKHTRPWQIWSISATVIITVVGLFSYFVAPEWIKNRIEIFIRENIIGKQAIDIVTKETNKYLVETLNPLKLKTVDLEEQLKIQRYVIASKAGERDYFDELKKIVVKEPKLMEDINKAIREIEFYYDEIKYRKSGPLLGGSYLSPAIEDIIDIYRYSGHEKDVRESAIGTLINFYSLNLIKTNIVQELCESIDSEKNLRVIARTTYLLQQLTGEYFRPLEIDSVRKWWSKHKNETKYRSPYKYYFKALRYIKRGTLTDTKKRDVISLLNKTIDIDSDAIHARCIRGGFYSLIGEDDKAKEDFKYVKNFVNKFNQELQIKYEYKWLFFWEAASYVKQGKINNDAVNSLKKALQIAPELENYLKDYANKFEVFEILREKISQMTN